MTLRLLILVSGIGCAVGYTQDPDAKQRARAARDLAQEGSAAIPKLQPMLSDPDREVRAEAVKSIVEIGTQRSLDALVQAAKDNDPEIQIRATDGLVNFYFPGYIQGSMQRVGDSIRNRFSRENTDIVPSYVTVRPDVVPALGAVVRGGSTMESRANAARALGILRGKAAVPDLIKALQSKDDYLIFESLIALQKIRDLEAGSGVAFLLRDLEPRVQIAAIETTGLLQNKDAIPDLQKVLDRASDGKVRRAALGALAMLPDERNRSYYRRGFTDKDEGVRAAAAEGFGRLGSSADRQMLVNAFSDESKMAPRLASAFALVKLGSVDTSEFSPLRYLVNTLNSRQHRGVAEAYLSELAREPAVREALYGLIRQGTRDEKIGLGRVFAVSGDQRAVTYLEPLTKDSDAEVVQESVRALRSLKARLP